jgi:hypothetical protein
MGFGVPRVLTGLLLVLSAGCGGSGGSGGSGGPPTGPELFVLDASGAIWRYSLGAPDAPRGLVPVTGLLAGWRVVGIDVRPLTQQLHGLAMDGNGTGLNGQHVVIDTGTGVATPFGAPFALPTGAADGGYGVDFNPTIDRMRSVSSADVNFRVNPVTGNLVMIDTAITPPLQKVAAIAYDRNTPGPGSTTLYAINAQTAQLQTIGGINGIPTSPNLGALQNPLPLGVSIDASGTAAFDILGVDQAFAIFDGDPSPAFATGLYTINLATGAATLVGALGAGPALPVRGMAIR